MATRRSIVLPKPPQVKLMASIVFALYPGFTQLDFTGPYEVFCRLPGAKVTVASLEGGELRTEHGLTFSNMVRLEDVADCTLLCDSGRNRSVGRDVRTVFHPTQSVGGACNVYNIGL